jgi:TPP-dependent trihydroxycyclohexane-1,2-dione (THcHDO) dehydratase
LIDGCAELIESLINSSKRPLILAGTGIRLSKTVDELGVFQENQEFQ